jgi:hypothetical protein
MNVLVHAVEHELAPLLSFPTAPVPSNVASVTDVLAEALHVARLVDAAGAGLEAMGEVHDVAVGASERRDHESSASCQSMVWNTRSGGDS